MGGVGDLAGGQGLHVGAGPEGALAGVVDLVEDLVTLAPLRLFRGQPRPLGGHLIGPDDPEIPVDNHHSGGGGRKKGLGKKTRSVDLVLLMPDLLAGGDDVVKQKGGVVVHQAHVGRLFLGQFLQNIVSAGQVDDQVQPPDPEQVQVVGCGEDPPVPSVGQAHGLGVEIGHPHDLHIQAAGTQGLHHPHQGQTPRAAPDHGRPQDQAPVFLLHVRNLPGRIAALEDKKAPV